MKISCDGISLNIGFAIMKTWEYEGIKVKRVKNGYCVIIKEVSWAHRTKHKIFYRSMDDVTKYIDGLALVQEKARFWRYKGTRVFYEVPTGYASKKELKKRIKQNA